MMWKRCCGAYATVAKLTDQLKEEQRAQVTCCFHENTLETVDGLEYAAEEDKQDVGKVIELLENHFLGEINEIYESNTFFIWKQHKGESISASTADLRTLLKSFRSWKLKYAVSAGLAKR